MAYKIEIHRSAQKQLLALPRQAQIEIAQAIDHLAENPRPSGCKKLKGTELWRIRAGRYRVIYVIDGHDRIIRIVKTALRREDTYYKL